MSYILELENDQNPFEEKRLAIEKWEKLSIVNIDETESIIKKADDFVLLGIKAKDALHVSSAIEGKANYFITTDNRLLKKFKPEMLLI